jgi:flagellar hook-length control protein FliK
VDVTDLRKDQRIGEQKNLSGRKTGKDIPPRSESAGNGSRPGSVPVQDSGFSVARAEIEISSPSEGREGGRTAAGELARRLDSQAGNEIVRQVRVVLSRADAGEVSINLRPDNLGRVRVRIQVEENRLTGRIYVESAAARDAFRAALDGLQTRLVESGFGAADLELAWDDGRGGFEQRDGKPAGRADPGSAAREFENMAAGPDGLYVPDGRVNMVV